jgi:hypothetical protein
LLNLAKTEEEGRSKTTLSGFRGKTSVEKVVLIITNADPVIGIDATEDGK